MSAMMKVLATVALLCPFTSAKEANADCPTGSHLEAHDETSLLQLSAVMNGTGKQTRCDRSDAGLGHPACPGQPMLGQTCGDLNFFPDTFGYQFMESASSCKGCNYAYIPATRCLYKPPSTWKFDSRVAPADDLTPDPSCEKKGTVHYIDVFKFYPDRNHQPPIDRFVRIFAVPNFRAFGSKITQDGRFMFICDIGRGAVIGLDIASATVVFTMYGFLMPNDIAIWEQDNAAEGQRDIILYVCGGWKLAANTGVYQVKIWGEKEPGNFGWLKEEGPAGKSCAVASTGAWQSEDPIPWGNKEPVRGCHWEHMQYANTVATSVNNVCAGIGLDFHRPGPPSIWTANLNQFMYIDTVPTKADGSEDMWDTQGHWQRKRIEDVRDPGWFGNMQCTLPRDYSKDNERYGLIDNVQMLDENTMITAIYTTCASPSGVGCIVGAFIKNQLYTLKTDFMAVVFTKVCLNHYNKNDKNIGPISETYAFPLNPHLRYETTFNGRITHLEPVGNDLVAINYQHSAILVLKDVVAPLTKSCYMPRSALVNRAHREEVSGQAHKQAKNRWGIVRDYVVNPMGR